MIADSSSVVIVVLLTQVKRFSCSSFVVECLRVCLSRYLTHFSLLRIFVYSCPLQPLVMFLIRSGFMFFPVKNNADDKLSFRHPRVVARDVRV